MAEILSVGRIAAFSKDLKKQGKVVVLAGGCFDILHPGHTVFLERAKKEGDILVVLLTNLGLQGEIDKSIKSGAVECIVKSNHPPNEVLEIIKDILKKHRH